MLICMRYFPYLSFLTWLQKIMYSSFRPIVGKVDRIFFLFILYFYYISEYSYSILSGYGNIHNYNGFTDFLKKNTKSDKLYPLENYCF